MNKLKCIALSLTIFLSFGSLLLLAKDSENEFEKWEQERRLFFVACLFYGYKSLDIERIDSSLEVELKNLQNRKPMIRRVLAHAAEYIKGYLIDAKAAENEVPLPNARVVLSICYDKYDDKSLRNLLLAPINKEYLPEE